MSIGDNIREARTRAGLTLEELAQKVSVSRQTLSRYETGVISNIPLDRITAIAGALDTIPNALTGWGEEAVDAAHATQHRPIGNDAARIRDLHAAGAEDVQRDLAVTEAMDILHRLPPGELAMALRMIRGLADKQ